MVITKDGCEFLTAPPPVKARRTRFQRDLWSLLLNMPQPLIAAVHGYVLGSGIISSKRIGIGHKEYGVTSTGVVTFSEITMKALGKNIRKDPCLHLFRSSYNILELWFLLLLIYHILALRM